MKFNHIFKSGFRGDLLALVAGGLLTLAFAPFRIEPLAIISLALLAGLWLQVSTKVAAWRGWLFGIGLFGSGVYWVFISIHQYGGVDNLSSFALTGLFVIILALFPAYTGYLLNRFFGYDENLKLTYAFPALWVLIEWVRSWIFSGFPWLIVGYSQINSPLKGYAPLLSVFGVSLFVAYSSVYLVKITKFIYSKNYQKAYINFLLLILLWSVGSVLTLKNWTTPVGKPIKVSLVQGNIPQQLKWSPDSIMPTLKTYSRLTEPYWHSDIIVWPESAIPITLQTAENLINQLDTKAKKNNSTFITGIPVEIENKYYNAVIAVGNGHGIYLKHRLVPFGEYIPFESIFSHAFKFLDIPMTDFIADRNPIQPIQAGSLKLLAFICYEITFPEQVNFYQSDINLLLTVSNDAWFGHSSAQAQHLEMAAMRALETGRPLLFVSNNGLTAIVGPDGNIQSEAEAFTATVLTDTIQPTEGRTPWQKNKLDPVLMIATFAIFSTLWRQRKIKRQIKRQIKHPNKSK